LISLFILTIFSFWDVHPQTIPKQTIDTLKAGGERLPTDQLNGLKNSRF
jgi:hypothetical protein